MLKGPPSKNAELGGARKDEWKGIKPRVRQWDWSQIVDSFEGEDGMDWYEDDEMRQWEDVSKEEGKSVKRKTAGNGLQIEGVQRVPQLMVSQILTEEKELKKKEKKRKGGRLVHGEDGREHKQPVD